MTESRTCEICGGELKPRNTIGVCQSTPKCKSEYCLRWRKANAEHVKSHARQWREDNSEQRKANSRARYQDNKEIFRERYENNKDAYRERSWRNRGIIGMTVELYAELLTVQGGGCAICGIPPIDKALAVDHDHTITDRYNVRGLLCQGCNQHLGYVEKGSSNLLTEEKIYLSEFELENA